MFYVNGMPYKRMKVSLRTAFAMTRYSNAKALYEGLIIEIGLNIMMFGETTLALLAGSEAEE